MEIILKEDVIGLGEEGDIKSVADGYARNFLIPKGLALPKNKSNLHWLERQQSAIQKRKEEKSFQAKSLAEKLEGVSVTLAAKVSSGNKLYGSIHGHQISVALKEQGVEIDHRKIEVEPIKMLGDYSVKVKLYEGVQTTIAVKVVSTNPEEDIVEDIVDESSQAPAEAAVEEVEAVAEASEEAPADSQSEETEETKAE